MADAKKTVELVFQGVDKTGEATQAAIRNARSVTQDLQKVSGPIADITKSAVKVQASLLATGAAITAFSVKAAGDFDDAFREISTLIDAPTEDLGRFKSEIQEFASSSTQPLDEITTALYNSISAGVEFTESLEFVAQAEQLAISGNAGLNESLNVLISSLNAYGKGTEEAENYSDILFTTVRQGQTTLSELAGSLSAVTGTASTVGVGFDEINAAIAALTKTGTPTSKAVNQINQALSSILKPGKQAKDLAEELGIEFSAQALEANGLQSVLQEVAEKTGGSQEQMARLFGSTEALQAVLPLTGNAADAFNDSLEAMRESTGATETAFEKMADSFGLQNQRIVNSLRDVFISIGTPLLDEFGGTADAITSIFNSVSQDIKTGGLSELNGFIESLFGDLESTLQTVAKNLPEALSRADFSSFTRGVEATIGAVTELFEGVDLSTTDGLVAAIETVGTLFEGLGVFVGGVIDSFKPMIDALIEVGSGVRELNLEWVEMAGQTAGVITQLNSVLPLLEVLLGLMIAKQGMGIAGGAAAAAKSIGKLNISLKALGKAGGIGIIVSQLAALADGFLKMREAQDMAERSQDNADRLAGQLSDNFAKISENVGMSITSIEELEAALDSGKIVAQNGVFVKAADAVVDSQGEVVESLGKSGEAFKEAEKDSEKFRLKMAEIASDESIRELEIQTKLDIETQKANVELRKFTSQERIATIETRAEIDVAQIQANATKVKGILETIDTGISSTGDLIGGLFGQIGQGNMFDDMDVRSQIDDENRRREQQFQLQKELSQEQIKNLRAQTERISRGESVIQIDGAGLQPHLEAFMWEIISAVQVRVNADGLDMLMGS